MRNTATSLLLIWMLAVPAVSLSSEVPTVDLREVNADTPGLPWLLESRPEFSVQAVHPTLIQGVPQLLIDLDQDGQVESLKGGTNNFTVRKIGESGQFFVQDQFNLPLEYKNPRYPSTKIPLAGPFDVDGDGRIEVAAWSPKDNHLIWGFWLVDPVTLEQKSHFTLGCQRHRKDETRWDGNYSVIGTMPGLLDNPRHEALVIVVQAGHDAYGRGIMAVDPFTGAILWHFTCGPDPIYSKAWVTDLEGDGLREIVFLGRSPDNLNGEVVGGYSDDQTRLFVLDPQGREIWSRQLAGKLSTGEIALGNVDRNPGPEIVTVARMVRENGCTLQVWAPDGTLKAESHLPITPNQLILFPRTDDPARDILINTRSGKLQKYRLENTQLVLKRQALFYSQLRTPAVIPLGPGQVPHLLTLGHEGTARLLDRDFNPVATAECEPRASSDLMQVMDTPEGPLALRIGKGIQGYRIIPNPDALPSNALLRFFVTLPLLGWVLIAVILGGLISWWIIHRRHRGEIRARAVIPGDHRNLREAHLHLLEDLELSGHGAIAPLRSLRRLIWLLDALKTGIDFNGEIGARFREIWQDCHQEDLPRLLVILDRARAAELNHPSINIATAALQKAQHLLSGFKKADFDVARMEASGPELHELSDSAEAALQDLRCEVAALFRADIQKVVDRVLRANRPEIEAAGITVQTGMMAAAAGGESAIAADVENPACRMDPSELGFIVDNLVGNAVRAMAGSQDRQLRINWLVTNGLIKLEVHDTGVGIAHEDMDRILESPFSTREGGGLGLPKSVRLLRKYSGALSIKSSSPGRGTTFQVLVPRAMD
jgi:signal transduction histidine kinase